MKRRSFLAMVAAALPAVAAATPRNPRDVVTPAPREAMSELATSGVTIKDCKFRNVLGHGLQKHYGDAYADMTPFRDI